MWQVDTKYVRPVGGCGVTQLSLAGGKILKLLSRLLLSDKGDYSHYPGQNINRNVVIIFQQGRRNWIMNQIMLILKILFLSPIEVNILARSHISPGA